MKTEVLNATIYGIMGSPSKNCRAI